MGSLRVGVPRPMAVISQDRPHTGTRLYPGGQNLWVHTALKTNTTSICSGRDVGKTATHLFLVEEESSLCDHYYDAGYIAQSHAKAEERYEEWLARWDSIPGLVVDHKNKDQLRYIKLAPWGRNPYGWAVHFLSGDVSSVEGARGLRLDRILLDEAGLYLTKKAMAAIWPMGNSRQAKMLVTGTPSKKGIGYAMFKLLFDLGQKHEPGYASFNAPSECAPWNDPEWIQVNNPRQDPHFLLRQRIAMRDPAHPGEKTPEELEEFDGVFTSDLGALFINLDRCVSLEVHAHIGADPRDEDSGLYIGAEPVPYRQYVIGQDWGLVDDRSVSCVLDRQTREMVALRVEPLERHGGRYEQFISNLDDLHNKYNKALIIGDGSGVGNYLGKEVLARRYGTYYRDIRITNGGEHDKGKYVTRMRKLFQDSSWRLLEIAILKAQFAEFTSKPMHVNGLSYSAPAGRHDDVVMACLYASTVLDLPVPHMLQPKGEPHPFSPEGFLKAQSHKNHYRPYVIGSRP